MIEDIKETDFVCFTETHLNSNFPLNYYTEIETFCEKKNNLGRSIKGVSVYFKTNDNSFNVEEIVAENGDTIIIKLSNHQWKEIKEIFMIICYRESRESKYADKNYLDKIKKYISKFKMKNILMLGDLNSRTGKLNDNQHLNPICRSSEDVIINKQGRELINFCNETSLIIANGRYEKGMHTYCRNQNGKNYASVIDYLIMSESLISKLKAFEITEPKLFTDHRPMKIELNIALKTPITIKRQNCKIKNKKYVKPSKWTTKFENSKYQQDIMIKSTNLMKKIETENLDKVAIYNELINIDKEIFKDKDISERKAIYSESTRILRKTYTDKVQVYKLDSTNENLNTLLQTKKELNRATKKEKRNMQRLQLNELQTAKANKDPKKYWELLNKNKTKKQNKLNPNLTANSFKQNIKKDDQIIEKMSSNWIKKPILYCITAISDGTYLNRNFTTEEIQNAVQCTKNFKASGPDGMVYEMFKNNSCQIMILQSFFNNILNDNDIPWNTSWIIPMYKKGNKNDTSSYRYLNLSSCIEKILTKILNDRLDFWMNKHQIIHQSQTGFRKGHSTIDNIWLLKEIIQIYRNNKKPIYICFIDLSKAFDSISKRILIHKLKSLLPTGKYLSLLETIISNRSYKILYNGIESEEYKTENGIPQGDSLSPTLFCIYMNNFLKHLDEHMNIIDPIKIINWKIASMIYADDIVLMSESKKGIIKQIDLMQNYCENNNLKINYDKTKIMILNEPQKYDQLRLNIKVCKIEIQVVEEYKYLGVWIAKTDRKQIEAIETKGKTSSYITAKTLKEFDMVDGEILKEAFEMLTLSKMKYAGELYFDKNLNCLNRVIVQFFKRFYHLRSTTPNYCITGEFGIKPVEFHFYYSAIVYFIKLNNEENKRLQSQCFDLINNNLHLKCFRNTWCYRMNNLFRKIHLHEIDKLELNNKTKKMINNFLTNYFRSEWINSAKNSNKGIKYLEICRFECDLKQYLKTSNNNNKFEDILKLRTGNHTLAAETGTYQNRKTYKDCICKQCDLDETEDAFHFISICPRFHNLRNDIIPFMNDCTRLEFCETMNALKSKQVRLLNDYIKKALVLRNT